MIEGAPPEVSQLTATTFEGLEVGRRPARARRPCASTRTDDDPLTGLIGVREVLPGTG